MILKLNFNVPLTMTISCKILEFYIIQHIKLKMKYSNSYLPFYPIDYVNIGVTNLTYQLQ